MYRRAKKYWAHIRHKGRNHQISLGTDNAGIAREKGRRLRRRLQVEGLDLPARTPLFSTVSSFCRHLRRTRSTKKSWASDFSYLRGLFGEVCPELRVRREAGPRPAHWAARVRKNRAACNRLIHIAHLEDLTPHAIAGFINRRIDEDGISNKTANRYREVLLNLFNFARKHLNYRCPDPRFTCPVQGVDRYPERASQIRFLSLQEIEEQLAVLADAPPTQAVVATLIYAGLRREEISWLAPDDVDLDAGLIRVRAKTVNGQSWQPKTRRNRAVPISRDLFEYLRGYTQPSGSLWNFPSPHGCRWDPDNFSSRLRRLNRAAGLPWSCLDFRHTFGSQLAQKGESLHKISELMGNSPAICRRHYAALTTDAMRESVEFPTHDAHNGGGEGPHLRLVKNPESVQENGQRGNFHPQAAIVGADR